MFAVLSVSAPTSNLVTRIVFDEIEPAEIVGDILSKGGYTIEAETCPIAPIRYEDEERRAMQLITLALAPVEGTVQ